MAVVVAAASVDPRPNCLCVQVRWADIEESKQQKRMRDIGFVVGQTDWSKFTDPSQAEKALTRTKYI